MNHSIAKVWARGGARGLIVLMMLTSVLPSSRARAAGSPAGPTPVVSQINIFGPPGSQQFGTSVTLLPNGNIVVTDPYYSITGPTPVANVGAAYLYNGATGALISMLTGSNANDFVGGAVTVLVNGNYLVSSNGWNDYRGAVTWGSRTTGARGIVSATNSLVGSLPSDRIGWDGVTVLTNGNYVVNSPPWHSIGAVTWGNGATGTSGLVSMANSLVGSTQYDAIGSGGAVALTNGNYVVCSQFWHNGVISAAGAVTWGNGTNGTSGLVSAANSLVGSSKNDSLAVAGWSCSPTATTS
ncbi:MAG: hypothetical protein ACJ74G_16725 [Blastocatellia bacterium]